VIGVKGADSERGGVRAPLTRCGSGGRRDGTWPTCVRSLGRSGDLETCRGVGRRASGAGRLRETILAILLLRPWEYHRRDRWTYGVVADWPLKPTLIGPDRPGADEFRDFDSFKRLQYFDERSMSRQRMSTRSRFDHTRTV
jgi:hypothetical protein